MSCPRAAAQVINLMFLMSMLHPLLLFLLGPETSLCMLFCSSPLKGRAASCAAIDHG